MDQSGADCRDRRRQRSTYSPRGTRKTHRPNRGAFGVRKVKLFYSPKYVAAGYSFDTTRKSAWIAESLRAQQISTVELVEPSSITEAQLRMVHDPAYISAVKTGTPRELAESQGFTWDSALWQTV